MVLRDGSLIRTRRTGTEKRKNYSGKHQCHGLLVIALTDDCGRRVRVFAVRPGRSSEITACRQDGLTVHLRAAGLGAIADLGFVGLDDAGPDADPAVIAGYEAARRRPLIRSREPSSKALAAVRAPVEHGFAPLKNGRVLGKVRTDPRWATALLRALLVLTTRNSPVDGRSCRWTTAPDLPEPPDATHTRSSDVQFSPCTVLTGTDPFDPPGRKVLVRADGRPIARLAEIIPRPVSRNRP
ncbi:transposase [Streptomyces sp. AM 2-1-1]|uniref:transposase n=1 Tax=Streptomyces sp. AM 2-1-1 TaxID=3028709 RepID=UPI0023B9764B|nr:transposase [Streptomyces sp. AM 2-1-1]WEH43290.1 transposase family protein [Streptomyces sp. AM 2-1-1]